MEVGYDILMDLDINKPLQQVNIILKEDNILEPLAAVN